MDQFIGGLIAFVVGDYYVTLAVIGLVIALIVAGVRHRWRDGSGWRTILDWWTLFAVGAAIERAAGFDAVPAIRAGAFGFNPALTAIALYGVFFAANATAAGYALLGAVVTAVVFAGASAALEPIGMPALTLPFVLVTWCFVAAGPLFPRLRAP